MFQFSYIKRHLPTCEYDHLYQNINKEKLVEEVIVKNYFNYVLKYIKNVNKCLNHMLMIIIISL